MENQESAAEKKAQPVPPAYKRNIRNILIHRPLQREYSLLMIAIMMISSLVVAAEVHFTMKEAFMGDPYRIGAINPYQVLSDVNHKLIFRLSITLMLSCVVGLILGVFYLHRVAGPVYRFGLILKKLRKGEIPRNLNLRDRDYFKEVAEEFNGFFEVLRAKEAKLDEMIKYIESQSSGLSDAKSAAAWLQIGEDLKRLKISQHPTNK